jgi:hypothetical protein
MKNPVHKTLIARKLREGITYRVEVDRLEDTTIEIAPSYSDKLVLAIMKYFFY